MREVNDWMFFNSLVYKIYTISDEKMMRQRFLEQLNMLVDFDAADFFLAVNGDGFGLCNPVLYNSSIDSSRYDELDYSRGLMYDGDCMAYKETDIISDTTRTGTQYYKVLYKPNGWHYSAQMIFAYKKQFIGVVTLYRNIGKEDFDHSDIMVLDMLKDHMAFRLYKDRNESSGNKVKNINAFSDKYELTKREKTVLEHIMSGEENSDISSELYISIHTLKKHILNIYRKAEVNSRLQLVNKVQGISC